jgi:hypothetical protein
MLPSCGKEAEKERESQREEEDKKMLKKN